MNEVHINLEKTTSGVLFAILLYLWGGISDSQRYTLTGYKQTNKYTYIYRDSTVQNFLVFLFYFMQRIGQGRYGTCIG